MWIPNLSRTTKNKKRTIIQRWHLKITEQRIPRASQISLKTKRPAIERKRPTGRNRPWPEWRHQNSFVRRYKCSWCKSNHESIVEITPVDGNELGSIEESVYNYQRLLDFLWEMGERWDS
jgi:hypothetical protein